MPLPQTPVYRHLRPGQMTGLQPGKDGFPPGFAAWRVQGPGLSLLICKVGEALPALNENGQAHSGSPNGLSGKKKKKKAGNTGCHHVRVDTRCLGRSSRGSEDFGTCQVRCASGHAADKGKETLQRLLQEEGRRLRRPNNYPWVVATTEGLQQGVPAHAFQSVNLIDWEEAGSRLCRD